MKWLKITLVALLVLLGGLIITRNMIIRSAAVAAVEYYTGVGVELDTIHVGLLKPEFELKGFRLKNPEGFPEPTAFEVKDFLVVYDPRSFFGDVIHLRRVDMNIPKVVVVENARGESNWEAISKSARKKSRGQAESRRSGKSPKEDTKVPKGGRQEPAGKSVKIDELTIYVGSLEKHVYKAGQKKPEVEIVKMDRRISMHDVTDPSQVMMQLYLDFVAKSALERVARKHKGDVNRITKKLEETGSEAGRKLSSFLKSLSGSSAERGD